MLGARMVILITIIHVIVCLILVVVVLFVMARLLAMG